MRVQLSYPFTGEDKAEILRLLSIVASGLTNQGWQVSCLALDYSAESNERLTPRAAMHAAFAQIDAVDALLVLQTSPRRSEGMIMEVGYALAQGKHLIVAAHESATPSYLPMMAHQSFIWQTHDNLAEQLMSLAIPHGDAR